MSMTSFLRKHQRSILAGTLVVFLGIIFVGMGGYWFTNRDSQGLAGKVGKERITTQALMLHVDNYAEGLRRQGKELDDAQMSSLKHEMLTSIMVEELLAIKADELGLVVTDEELARTIRSNPIFIRDGKFDKDAYILTIRSRYHQGPEEFEREMLRSLKSAHLKSLFARLSKVSPQELREIYGEANKGSFKNFEKEKDAFAARLQQQRTNDLVNQCLRRMQNQVEVRSYLDNPDSGA